MMTREEVNRLLFCLIAILLGLWLSGCATNCPTPEPKIQTQEVDVPTPVSCLGNVPPKPDYETGYLDPDTADGEVLLEMARNWVKAQSYEAWLQAAMVGCQKLPPNSTVPATTQLSTPATAPVAASQ